jgi:hypothetical protein
VLCDFYENIQQNFHTYLFFKVHNNYPLRGCDNNLLSIGFEHATRSNIIVLLFLRKLLQIDVETLRSKFRPSYLRGPVEKYSPMIGKKFTAVSLTNGPIDLTFVTSRDVIFVVFPPLKIPNLLIALRQQELSTNTFD